VDESEKARQAGWHDVELAYLGDRTANPPGEPKKADEQERRIKKQSIDPD
jgi:hypothetical protein